MVTEHVVTDKHKHNHTLVPGQGQSHVDRQTYALSFTNNEHKHAVAADHRT